MKLASWIYWNLDDLKRSAKRRAAVELVRKTGIDIAMCIWSPETILAHQATIGSLRRELADAGAELHAGICPFAAPPGPPETPNRRLYQYKADGKRHHGGLCPSVPENRDHVVATVERLGDALREAEVPGLHLDFIRYLFSAGAPWKLEWEAGREWIDTYRWCECDACRAARTKWLARPELTPYDRLHPGVIFKELEFRKRNVEDVFRRVRAATNARELVLSIAQRVQYLNRAILEGQDWMEWAEQGLFDFTCPMNYTTHTDTYRQRLEQNMRRLSGRPPNAVRVYEGVSRKSSAGESPIETVLEQMSAAMELGADGVTLFHLGVLKDGEHEKIRRWKRANGDKQ
jgi:hypothetical protein